MSSGCGPRTSPRSRAGCSTSGRTSRARSGGAAADRHRHAAPLAGTGRLRGRRRRRAAPRRRRMAALSGRAQAGEAQGAPGRRGAALRPGHRARGDVRRRRARGRALLRQGAAPHRRGARRGAAGAHGTVAAAGACRIPAGRTPAPGLRQKRCDACSLLELCKPHRLDRPRSVARLARRRSRRPGRLSSLPTETTA